MAESVEKWLVGYPAGKAKIAHKLAPLAPDHSVYIEPFCGTASVFFDKKAADVEILCDLDPEVVTALRAVKRLTAKELRKLSLRNWVSSRDQFDTLKESEPARGDRVSVLHKFLYLSLFGFRRFRKKYAADSEGRNATAGIMKRLEKSSQRMHKGVRIFCADYSKGFEFDGKDSFFYLDPPYPGYNAVSDAIREKDFDEERFVGEIAKIKGKFLITYGTKTAQEFSDYRVVKISPTRLIGNQDGKAAKLETLLVSNYEFEESGLTDMKVSDLDSLVSEASSIVAQGDSVIAQAEALAKSGAQELSEALGGAAMIIGADLTDEELREIAKSVREGGDPLEGGAHGHGIKKGASATDGDGAHSHVFVLPDGSTIETEFDGEHRHGVAKGDRTAGDGAHSHSIELPDGSVVETSEVGSMHAHELQTDRALDGGLHAHVIKLSDGTLLSSLPCGVKKADVPTDEQTSYHEHINRISCALREAFGKQEGAYYYGIYMRDVYPSYVIYTDETNEKLQNFRVDYEIEDGRVTFGEPIPVKQVFVPDADKIMAKGKFSSKLKILSKAAEDAAAEERYVLGIVLEPEVEDSQKDIYSADEIRKAAHDYMLSSQNMGFMHKELANDSVKILESYIAPVDFEIDGETVSKGTWLMGVRIVDDEMWKLTKSGDLTGFSIGGVAVRTPDDEDAQPDS